MDFKNSVVKYDGQKKTVYVLDGHPEVVVGAVHESRLHLFNPNLDEFDKKGFEHTQFKRLIKRCKGKFGIKKVSEHGATHVRISEGELRCIVEHKGKNVLAPMRFE